MFLPHGLQSRYGGIVRPITIKDDRGEAEDAYIIYPMGEFIVEVSIPQHGSFVTAVFARRSIYEHMRKADGSYEVVGKYLQ